MTIRFSDRPYATNLIERWQTGRSHERASHDCQHPNALSSASTSNWYRGAVCRPAGFPLRRRTSGRADEPTVILADSLWISGCPIDYAWLQEQRIDLVVDVADPELRLEPDMLGAIVYCKEALVDGPDLPAATVIDRLVQDVVTAVREGDRVLVACAGGRNRSGLVVALAARDILGCSGAEALQLVQSRRENALNNMAFAGHLASLPRRDSIDGLGQSPTAEARSERFRSPGHRGGRPLMPGHVPGHSTVLVRPLQATPLQHGSHGPRRIAKPRKSLRLIRITKLKTT